MFENEKIQRLQRQLDRERLKVSELQKELERYKNREEYNENLIKQNEACMVEWTAIISEMKEKQKEMNDISIQLKKKYKELKKM